MGWLGKQQRFSILFVLACTFLLILIVSRQECVMHVDGSEEVLHDEVENVCSNDGKLLKTQ